MNRLWFGMFAACLLPQDQPLFHVDTNLVTVPVLVTDATGAPVRDLQLADFRLYDNGAPRGIRQLSLQAELPLAVGMVVDDSAFLLKHQSTLGTFLDHLLRRNGDSFFYISVDKSVKLRAETIPRPKGASRVRFVRGGEPLSEPCQCGGAVLWDGIYAAIHSKLSGFQESKALIVLSDGNDNGTTRTLDWALDAVRRSAAVVYAIRSANPLSDSRDGGLFRLAAESGGAEFQYDALKYADALDRVQTDLRSQYVLSFYPGTRDTASHTLRVETVRPGLTVRSRREYLAQ